MDKTELSLADALNMITELEKKSDERLEEINDLARNAWFMGKMIGDMTPNRLLYYIATHEAMVHTIRSLAKDFEQDIEDALVLTECTENGKVIDKMEGILLLHLEMRAFEAKISALRQYTKSFDDADYKRIRKEKSLKILKELQVI